VPDSLPADWSAWRGRFDPGTYDTRWERLAAAGVDPHGEAALVMRYAPRTVLDGGCGTGRVAVELARRGVDVVGVDVDADMIDVAHRKAPELRWLVADLADLALDDRVDVVVLAGNVIPYVPADRRAAAVAGCARHLVAGGRLIAGFALRRAWPRLDEYDEWCATAGLRLEARWSTWEWAPYEGGGYAVSVHRLTGRGGS